ncbi:MAG: T9SS type A sorting domain-containing protein [Ignavibacteria bacterium]|nr:T9SS type A sorting domain-containing protein [Ignavibacteria bacterium]
MLQFVTTNGFGNNLYIDNVISGRRPDFDIAVTSINNIKKDTTYLPNVASVTLHPSINVTNLGLANYGSIYSINLEIPELQYTSTLYDSSIFSGQTKTIIMDSVVIPTSMNFSLTAYLGSIADSNNFNDTLKQNSVFLKAVAKNLFIEQFTSATSPSCGANDQFLDTLIYNHFNSVCAVKYHTGFPPPGIDSMYLADSIQVNQRRNYYFVNTVPYTVLNGRSRLPLPYYSLDSSIYKYYFVDTINNGSPVSIAVTDALLPGDTIQSTISVNFLYPVSGNRLRLKIAAIEKLVSYSNPIGASGESQFYDVFRAMLPDSAGYPISGNPGSSQFVIKYHVDSLWKDTSMYTVAFIQNDENRDVINCAKSIYMKSARRPMSFAKANRIAKPDFDKRVFPKANFFSKNSYRLPGDSSSYFDYQNFEGPFPPPGWIISNPDGYLSFEKFVGVNGVTLGGNSSIRIPFYDYANIGQKDTLYSAPFDSVSSYDTLSFDYAYAVYLSTFVDSLTVNISTDAGSSWTNIFNESGYELATALSTTQPFYPYNSSQWKTFRYPLDAVLPPENTFSAVPNSYELLQNYPNPFNPKTSITFRIPKDGFVTLKVYDILGRLMKTVVSQFRKANSYTEVFDGSGYSSGIYFYRLDVNGFAQTKKMVILK